MTDMAFVTDKTTAAPVLLKPFMALSAAISALLQAEPVPHWTDYLNDRDA
ncbi:hypothetical protein [Shimia sp. SDUM112013]